MQHTRSEVKAGAVILLSAILFMVITVAAGRFGEFFQKKQTVRVLFSDVQGLKTDDPVQVMGLEKGKVLGIDVTTHQDESGLSIPMVEVVAKVAYPEAFAKDTKISVDKTLTGNTVLKIEPGRQPEKLANQERIMGLGAVSMTELANKAGIMAKRLDDFIADLTDKNISGSIRAVMMNLKAISQDAKLVSASLSQSIPGIEKNLVSGVKNLADVSGTISQTIAANKEKISQTIGNVHESTGSLVSISNNIDKLVAKSQDRIHSTMANVEKSTANIKAVTREVRWQPWVLLNKPDEVEIRERSIYNSALEFSEGAETLNSTVKELVTLVARSKEAGGDPDKYKALLEQIHQNLEKSAALERKLWTGLTDKLKSK